MGQQSGRFVQRFVGVVSATAVILAVAIPLTSGVASAGGGASLAQCKNGSLTAHGSCTQGSTYVNGDLNSSNSHYREGDFVPYTAILTGLGAGANDLNIGYEVVDKGLHAEDYLGSYDTTETTSSTPSTLFANNNNPCSGLTMPTACTPASPTSEFPVPAPDFAGTSGAPCNAAGSFTGAQVPGDIKLFGAPALSTITNVVYTGQNQAIKGGCATNVDIQLNLTAALTAGQSIVLAWGGHVASQQDWGAGNSASFISGSPYHMFFNSLNGTVIGSQDHQMKTSAVFFTPSISTTIINNATSAPLSGPIPIGGTVHDTATLTNASNTASGTITFTLRNDTGTTACGGTTVGTPQVVTLTPGQANSPNSVPSSDFSPTSAGSYSYQAVYSGDASDVPGNFTSACEPFTVTGNTPTLTTAAQFSTASTGPWSAASSGVAINDYVRDTSSLAGAASPIAGNVTYTLYTGTGCGATNNPTGSLVFTDTEPASSATPTPSAPFQVTTAGAYQWQAVFNPTNIQNTTATSACGSEPFTVNPNTPTLTTAAQVSTASTGPWSPASSGVAINNFVRDTSTLTGAATPIAGNVTYTLYTGTGCGATNNPTGTQVFTDTEPASSATPTPSAPFQVTLAGSYQWQATFTSTNGQNTTATSACGSEPFTVNPNSPTLSTQAQWSANNVTWNNFTGMAEPIGTFVRDTATLTGAATPTDGTVTYKLYTGSSCSAGSPTGTVKFSDTVTLTSTGSIPPSASTQLLTAGTYQWQAVYTSKNGQNLGATSPCGSEVITIGPNAPTLTTQAQSSSSSSGPWTNLTTTAVPIGTFVRDTATLTNAATPTTGTVTYKLYTGTSCSGGTPTGTVVFTSTKTLSKNAIPPSAATKLLTAGLYQWQAVYTSGNTQNNDATSACGTETFTVGPNSPTLTTTAQSSSNNVTFTNVSGPVPIGTFVRDTAKLTGAATPTTGTVTYTLYNGTSCTGNTPSGTVVFTSKVTLASNAIPPSLSTQFTSAGAYQWQAVYTSGNAQNSDAVSTCGSEVVTVQANSPTLTTQAQSSSTKTGPFSNVTGPIAIGSYVRDTATLNNAATPTTGTVVYTLYTGTSCTGNTPSGTVVFTSSVKLALNAIPASAATQLKTAGSYQWQAVYTSGNGQNNNATSACGSEPFMVQANSPSLFTQAQSSSKSTGPFNNIVGSIAIGDYVRDTATLSGAATPTTGTVTYTLYTGSGCSGNTPSGSVVFTSTVTLANNAIPPSGAFQLATAGTYQWQAVYTSGNGQNNNATSTCGTEGLTVAPNSPSLSTQAQSSSASTGPFSNITGAVPIGTYVRDTATLTNAATPTTGQVVYTLYSGTSCSANTPTGSVVFTSTVTLANNAIPPSAATQLTTAGTYQWQAVYTSGNGQNNNATSACGTETFTVGPNSPSLSTQAQSSTASGGPFSNITGAVPIGTFVRDTATLSGAATPTTGTVAYTLYGGTSCSGGTPTGSVVFTNTVTLANNAIPASGPFQLTTAGTYQWQAVYTSGNGQNKDATSACGSETFTVSPNSPTLSTQAQSSTASGGPFSNITGTVSIGTYVRDTATLSGAATPTTGTVTYTLYSGTTCTGNTPSGTVQFTSKVTLANNAIPPSAATQLLTAGLYQWQAVYTSGNGQNNDATSACGTETFTVGPNSPTLSTQAQSSSKATGPFSNVTGAVPIGTYVRDTATLSGAATPTTGTVTYTLYTGTTCTGNAPSGTVVFTSTVTLAHNAIPASAAKQLATAGTYQWQAVYTSGNGQNSDATSACGTETFTVAPNAPTLATLAQSSSASTGPFSNITGAVPIGTFVRDTATLSGAATPTTGTVTYTLYSGTTCTGNTPSGTVVFTSTVTLASNAIPPSSAFQLSTAGTYQWQAVYTSGNGQNNGATSACGTETFTVSPNSPALFTAAQTSTDNTTFTPVSGPVAIDSYERDTATLTGAATPTTGTTVFTLYSGSGCTRTGVPTGTVEFTSPETLSRNAIPTSGSFQILTAGTYQWQAVYTSGNGQNKNATSPCGTEVVTVQANSPTLATAAQSSTDNTTFTNVTGPIALNSYVRDTATLTGAAKPTTGKVVYTLYSGTSCTGNTPSGTSVFSDTVTLGTTGIPDSGSFQLTTAGGYQWQAVYTSGNGQNNDATSACGSETFTVAKAATTMATVLMDASTNKAWTNTETAGATAYDTATLSGAVTGIVPTGTVTYSYFTNGKCTSPSSSTQTVTLTATGTVPNSATTASLSAGSYSFDAIYNGDTNYAASTVSPCEPFTVAAIATTPATTPTTAPPTTTTTAPPVTQAAIAFTGADIAGMVLGGMVLLGTGTFLVIVTRRRRRTGHVG